MKLVNFIDVFLARQFYGSSGTTDIELQLMVSCTVFLYGWWS